jgi:hypothetical protein
MRCIQVDMWNSGSTLQEYKLQENTHFYCMWFFFFFFSSVLGFELRAYTLSHSTSPFLWLLLLLFFDIGSHKLFAWGWLRTSVLLISVSKVARITGVSHRHPACYQFYSLLYLGLGTVPDTKQTRYIFVWWERVGHAWNSSSALPWVTALRGYRALTVS